MIKELTNYVVCPDSFKDCLHAEEVGDAIAKGIYQEDPHSTIHVIPLGDGGEGSLSAIAKHKSSSVSIQLSVLDPLMRQIQSSYISDGVTAYIEMASASGLELLTEEERNGYITTSFGTGQLLKDAIGRGHQNIYLLIGGSATNDMGLGMAQALGFQFYSKEGLIKDGAGGKDLQRIIGFENGGFSDFEAVNINVVCDVENPLYGQDGATYCYGKQKGSTPGDLDRLEMGMIQMADLILKTYGIDLKDIKGAGAAGGMAAGAIAFLGASLIKGAPFMLEITECEESIKNASVVVTGEGRMDHQTWKGKLISYIADMCKHYNKELYTVCGVIEVEERILEEKGVYRSFSLHHMSGGEAYTAESTRTLLIKVGTQIARLHHK